MAEGATASPEAQALLARWRTETDFTVRDELLTELLTNGIFPGDDQDQWEVEGGLYPDLEDPQFLPKLMRKREFQESLQKSVKESLEEGKDRCRSSEDFELSPVQRFVSRFLSPRTPYQSALLYHGVGVGKTCAAITLAESYLEAFPGRKVFIVAPPNIQEGFKRTIFDASKDSLTIQKPSSGKVNTHRGCTGNIYLQLTNTEQEQNRVAIEAKVNKMIRSRYEFFGYTSFYNYIRDILKNLPKRGSPAELERMKRETLRREFSNRILIIDEAHNLRDNPMESEEEEKDDANPQDTADAKAGKRLTPYLREVLDAAEGMTFLLMTATPMYNTYTEILFLLNLLLQNDKLPQLRVDDVFNVKGDTFMPGGERLLGKIASQYISFMRGENPLTFPLRLEPQSSVRIRRWASKSPKGESVPLIDRRNVVKLPCVGAFFAKPEEEEYKKLSASIVGSAEGLGITNLDLLVQAGNWIYPAPEGTDIFERIRQTGFDGAFTKEYKGTSAYFRSVEDIGADWMLEENLVKASGKGSRLIKRLKGCRGVAFVYSRFVATGALTIALALEANGYTLWGRTTGLLGDGNQHPEGRQCALCPRHEKGHGMIPEEAGTPAHAFKPAKYVVLTGTEEISPNNAAAINAARAMSNKDGGEIKVVIGSQIAGEGLDLRFIREVFVFDSWYHLNKLEQIVGRGIRNCSHAALEEEKRNCTITLLVNQFASDPETETIDMYSYRQALKKAVIVGNVTRVLKENAIDCTLNHDAILVSGLDPIPRLLDSQGQERRDVNRNDVPLTAMCDWLETCEYNCKAGDGSLMPRSIAFADQDLSTYDEYTARFQLSKLKAYIEDTVSKGKPFLTFENLVSHFETIPRPLLSSLLNELILQKEFRIKTSTGEGRLLAKNGFYVFQPDEIQNTKIPIAIRLMNVPVARDRFDPRVEKLEKTVEEEEGLATEEDSEEFWNESVKWVSSLKTGTAEAVLPPTLETELAKLKDSAGVLKAQKERLEMVLWLYDNLKGSEDARKKFADVVLEYIWDEFMTTATKRELIQQWENPEFELVTKVAKDAVWEFEESRYLRLLNGSTNQIEYLCMNAGGEYLECSKAVVEVLKRERESDPLLQKPIDSKTTGLEYGMVTFNPKKLKLVFKKNKPPVPRGKLGRGSECSINSATAHELKMLEEFGGLLRGAGQHDLGCNAEVLARKRIQNSIRVCTVSDLVLRYMDHVKIQGKRWFYRPLEAALYGHPLR